MEIEIISKEIIKPSSPTPPHLKTYDLSILDQLVVTSYVSLCLFYPNHNGDTISQALERSLTLKNSLSKTLTQFYPLAGTIKDDLSIDCNDVGANFELALVHHRLDEFLSHPDLPLVNKFFPCDPNNKDSSESTCITNVQMNIFDCGGTVIGMCISHKILDGSALYTFLKGWTNMACGVEEVIYPNLTASSLFPAKSMWLRDTVKVVSQPFFNQGKSITKRFVFSSAAIAELKTEATRNGVKTNPTRVEVVCALLWKCVMAASKATFGTQKTSFLSHFVNLRRQLEPTMSKDLIGNMLWISEAVWPSGYEPTLHGLVNKVHESISKIDREFVKKAQGDQGYVAMQKSLEENDKFKSKGPIESYCFTSWCNMGFYDIDFGWGKPSWLTGHIDDGLPEFMNLVTLKDTKCGGGVEAEVILDEEIMRLLQGNPELIAYASLDPSPL